MTRPLPDGLLVAWYGDDFTGSAAVMEVLAFAGLPTVLFLDVPTPDQLEAFPDVRAIGIAGTARSRPPDWMEAHLPGVFRFLKELDAPVVQYKVCSTLDSSPGIGSIGRAIDIAMPILDPAWVPVLVAAPAIRRYQAFGHLFAGAPDGVFRLDRHPVMARHPVTPMDEADVATHLARQTERSFGLVDLEALASDEKATDRLAMERAGGAQIVTLDTVDGASLAAAGRLIWEEGGTPAFAVGSQGIEYALVGHWRRAGLLDAAEEPGGVGQADRIVVVSGSVSAVTEGQIEWALAHGFQAVPFDGPALIENAERAEQDAVDRALDAVASGKDPLVYTARGPNDPAIAAFRQAASRAGLAADEANGRLGAALGRVLARVLAETGISRAVISGGDTSGHASAALGIYALTALAPTIPGAALFAAHSDDPALSGLQIALKGGQMGTADYFGWIRQGGGRRQPQVSREEER